MKKPAKATIEVQGTAVSILSEKEEDYICLTDIARFRNPEGIDDLIRNWLRNRNTIEFLGIWERLYNPDFNPVEFDGIKMQAGLNSFTLNSEFIHMQLPPPTRLTKLNAIAIRQMNVLTVSTSKLLLATDKS